MRRLLVTVTLSMACHAATAGDWTTQETLKAAAVTLHWTHVEEADDGVYQVTYKNKANKPLSFKVGGQPIVSHEESLIAFLGCADDGCSPEIAVVDVQKETKVWLDLPLPQGGAPYLDAKWQKRALIVSVKNQDIYVCSVDKTPSCTKQ